MDVPAYIATLSRASGALSPNEANAIQKVAEVGKEVLGSAFQDLVIIVAGSPVLTSKSADGTPITVVKRVDATMPGGKKIRRTGRECHEFLVKNQFGRALMPDGKTLTRVMLQDPLPLTHGKTSSAMFEACKKDWKSLRECGHIGCAVEHYCFDRCGFSSSERLWRQWHALRAKSFEDQGPQHSKEVLALSEFLLFTPCAVHDAHNAFRWSLFWRFKDLDLMRDTYISIESLRNSMGLLSTHAAEWAASRLKFVPSASADECDVRRCVWDALSVDMDTADLLAHTLQLVFKDGCLCVAETCSDMPDFIGTLTATLLSVWRFVRWSESRFLTVGSSSRNIVASLLVGIDDLVGFIKQNQCNSMFYLNGFSRLTDSRRSFLVQCAVVSRVSDSCLVELLEDPALF